MARFWRRGVSKIYWLPAVADITYPISPTRAEITAGKDLSDQIAEIGGFALSSGTIPTPNLADRFTQQIAGEETVPDSTLTMYDQDDSVILKSLLARDTEGFIAMMPYGDVPTKRCEIWPVTITGNNDEWSVGNDAARFMVAFAITAVPSQNGVVPAAGP